MDDLGKFYKALWVLKVEKRFVRTSPFTIYLETPGTLHVDSYLA